MENPQADYENEKYHHEMDQAEDTIAELEAENQRLQANLNEEREVYRRVTNQLFSAQREIERLRAEHSDSVAAVQKHYEVENQWQTQSCKQSLLTDQQAAEIERLRGILDERTLQHKTQLDNANRLRKALETIAYFKCSIADEEVARKALEANDE